MRNSTQAPVDQATTLLYGHLQPPALGAHGVIDKCGAVGMLLDSDFHARNSVGQPCATKGRRNSCGHPCATNGRRCYPVPALTDSVVPQDSMRGLLHNERHQWSTLQPTRTNQWSTRHQWSTPPSRAKPGQAATHAGQLPMVSP